MGKAFEHLPLEPAPAVLRLMPSKAFRSILKEEVV